MSALWTTAEIVQATGGTSIGKWQTTGVSIDSRTVQPGDLFVAISGERFDGHDYVAQALEDGAAGALVSRVPEGVNDPARLVQVEDTMDALRALAEMARARIKGKVIGVTGSVGKTGTRAMLQHALSAVGSVHATKGNLNNHIGTPLTLSRMPRETDFAVIEMGMNHAGEISPMSRMARPHAGLITQIAPVHIEFFDSLEGIAEAKAEIFAGLEPGGYAVINRDAPHVDILRRAATEAGALILGFGEGPEADGRLLSHMPEGWGARVEADICGVRVRYRLQHPGRFHALNSLGVLTGAAALGVLPDQAAAALEAWRPEAGRGQAVPLQINGKAVTLLDDSYNASPASVSAALEVLGGMRPEGRRVAVLGDMLELGEDAPAMHEALADAIAAEDVTVVHTAGVLMAHLHVALPESVTSTHWPNAEMLADALPDLLQSGDAVLVKGSHGSAMYRVADALKHYADTPELSSQDTAHVL